MERKLTQEEQVHLIKRHRTSRDKRVCDRIKAVLAFDDGYNYSEIAKILLLDDETIRRHIKDYFSKEKKLKPENGGSQTHLHESQSLELKFYLELKTFLYVKDICTFVKTTYGTTYSISGMTKWLQENGFRCKKPHGVPAKANADRQEDFIKQYETLNNALKPDEITLFADSAHPQHQTKLAYGWIRKGVRNPEKMTACQKRVNIIGAIDLDTHQFEYQKVDSVNKDSLKDFAKHL